MMMMSQNKKASAFTPMIENRGSDDTKQKVHDGSTSHYPTLLCMMQGSDIRNMCWVFLSKKNLICSFSYKN